ncbi:MAG: FAD-binding oxidoreductase, partial [Gemmatimonadaceae bacterium]|nr:FAD-binding oxidoreductase [Chitinophagaceae bacterium]
MKLQVIRPEDPQYGFWNSRGVNLQFAGKPAGIIPVISDEELAEALQQAVSQKQKLAVRGGGHCLENFVANDAVEIIIDISQLKGIRYDPAMNAIEVRAGNTVGEVSEFLSNEWNVVLPMGEHPDIGIGGHIQGGAFGFLCRRHGLGADFLYAVEMLGVNKDGIVQKFIAKREDNDINRDLWWAHTGGGAGNFGIVTRFWFRSY